VLEPSDEALQNSSFASQLIAKIVDNLQISIFNVHIRFEDTQTNPNVSTEPFITIPQLISFQSPFTAGVTLESLLAKSANEYWQPAFLHTPHKLVHKVSLFVSLLH
jgi:vacuolar protein sorting-associated protein 13A/C